MDEYTILVAITVTDTDRVSAQRAVQEMLDLGYRQYRSAGSEPGGIEQYWIAEDDRIDGSDCESAVFCTPGFQDLARSTLSQAHLVGEPDYAEWVPRSQRQRAEARR